MNGKDKKNVFRGTQIFETAPWGDTFGMKCVLKENQTANQPADNGSAHKTGASEGLNALLSGSMRTVSSPQVLIKPLFFLFKTKRKQ